MVPLPPALITSSSFALIVIRVALTVTFSLASTLMLSLSALMSISPPAAIKRYPMLCTKKRMPRLALANRRLPAETLVWPVLESATCSPLAIWVDPGVLAAIPTGLASTRCGALSSGY
ncbi:hypothetical protein D3C86_1487750 [compost metagenome]